MVHVECVLMIGVVHILVRWRQLALLCLPICSVINIHTCLAVYDVHVHVNVVYFYIDLFFITSLTLS